MTTTHDINHNDWLMFDARGYLTASGVEVRYYPEDAQRCATVRVGMTEHRADEMVIRDGGRRIESFAGWYLVRR